MTPSTLGVIGDGVLVLWRRRRLGESGWLRRITVTVDGVKVAKLWPGARVEVPVSAGSHEVVARMDWSRSVPLPVVVSVDGWAAVRVSSSYRWLTRTTWVMCDMAAPDPLER